MPPLGAWFRVICDCSSPSNRECACRGNVYGERPQASSGVLQWRKVPPKSPFMCLQGKCNWRTPSGAFRRPPTTKNPSEKSLQWRPRHTAPPWAKWCPPSPSPLPLRDFLNMPLIPYIRFRHRCLLTSPGATKSLLRLFLILRGYTDENVASISFEAR